MGFFKKVGKTTRILESETYKDTIKSTERLAQGTYGLLAEKSPEEAGQIGKRVTELSVKIQEIVGEEKPLVAALAILTALRVLDQHVQQQVKDLRAHGVIRVAAAAVVGLPVLKLTRSTTNPYEESLTGSRQASIGRCV